MNLGFARRYPVISFVLLSWALGWLGWGPQLLGSRGIRPFDHPAFGVAYLIAGLSPTLAALLVERCRGGRDAAGSVLRGLGRWRVGACWYLAALLAPMALFGLATLVSRVLAREAQAAQGPLGFGSLARLLGVNLVANAWEEIGWRGYALERLQRRNGALVASLVIALAWGLWHVPLFLIRGHPLAAQPFPAWLVGLAGLSLIYTWFYNCSGRSLPVVIVLHASVNAVGASFYSGSPGAVVVANVLVALALLLATRGRLGMLPGS